MHFVKKKRAFPYGKALWMYISGVVYGTYFKHVVFEASRR